MQSSADHGLELMNAVLDALKASAPVSAIVGDRVYDYVPSDAVEPYIYYGTAIEGPYEATGVIGSDTEITITGFLKDYDRVMAATLKKAIHSALADRLLPMAAGYMIEMNPIESHILPSSDDAEQGSYQILCRFQAVTGEEP